ncbi:hypothetical protein B0H12DRAFT_1101063 [Mycena haematopus]|nr:hypothetical protein B0H12DRAFT_1101063 [Mycena haematopus]
MRSQVLNRTQGGTGRSSRDRGQIGPKWPRRDSLGVRTLSCTSRLAPGLRIGMHGKITYHIKYKLMASLRRSS